jgi:dolichol-phosphate mannosyltransferase
MRRDDPTVTAAGGNDTLDGAAAARLRPSAQVARVELAIVVPTFNERGNVIELVHRLDRVLEGRQWEVIFVDDDSPDETAQAVRELAQTHPRVRCLQRIGRRGLSRAVIEGILSTAAPCIAVMDADLQHDETLLPAMIDRLQNEPLDLVVGSRYCSGGSIGAWDGKRARMSRLATALARLVVKAELSDPMSGFFIVRREAFHGAVRRLSGEGYKILLDLMASSPRPLRFAELPYQFRPRFAGQSKLDSAVVWQYLLLIIDKRLGHIVPARFVLFSTVGMSGLLVHFAVLSLLFRGMGNDFAVAQAAATVVAMTSNYAINNILTYRDSRRRGLRFLTGLLSFYLVCGLGAVANVGVASVAFTNQHAWWLSAFAGVLVGTVWNYAITSVFTWGKR